MKYGHIEKNTNRLLGWYDEEIHAKIPTPNIEVTDEVWQEAININANCYENGKFIVKDFRTNEEIENEALAKFRTERNILLVSIVDFYQKPLVWETLSNNQQEDIRQYRIALLDSTNSLSLPIKPTWIN